MKSQKPERQLKALPSDLRRQVQQRTIAHLLMLGWSVERIARKMHRTGRAIRYVVDRPDFQRLFEEMQQEALELMHRKMTSLLGGAVDALEKLLKHPDWRARDAAVEQVLRVHGKFIDRVDVHLGQPRQVEAQLVSGDTFMTEEMRQRTIELLALARQQRALDAQTEQRRRRALADRFSPPSSMEDDRNGNGHTDHSDQDETN